MIVCKSWTMKARKKMNYYEKHLLCAITDTTTIIFSSLYWIMEHFNERGKRVSSLYNFISNRELDSNVITSILASLIHFIKALQFNLVHVASRSVISLLMSSALYIDVAATLLQYRGGGHD